MKKCKSCQSMIDDKAKKCPKCQADQRNWFAKHPVITVILGIFLLMAIFGSSKNKNNTTGTKLSSENKVVTSETLLSKNNPDLKQISMMTMDYVDQPLTMYVKAEGCDYYNYEFREYILKNYTWEKAAFLTLETYKKVMNKERGK